MFTRLLTKDPLHICPIDGSLFHKGGGAAFKMSEWWFNVCNWGHLHGEKHLKWCFKEKKTDYGNEKLWPVLKLESCVFSLILTNWRGLICCRIFLIDSPSDRPSKSMKVTLAWMSRFCITRIHLVGTSEISETRNGIYRTSVKHKGTTLEKTLRIGVFSSTQAICT